MPYVPEHDFADGITCTRCGQPFKGRGRCSTDEEIAVRMALRYAWHNDRTGGHFDYDEWARLCEALLGAKDKAKAPTPAEMEAASMAKEEANERVRRGSFRRSPNEDD